MLASSAPRKLPHAFASNAGPTYKRTIPDASQIGITDGAASLVDGFVPLNATPRASGGVPPSIKDMNGILNDATGWAQWLAAGGAFAQYDSAFSTAIGGYPVGAVLASTTPGTYWRSTANNNTTDPDSGGSSNWAPFFPQSIPKATYTDVLAGTDATMYVTPAALRGASTFSFGVTGYRMEPTGYIEQWGADFTAVTDESPRTITFPIEFPNACLGIRGTVRNTTQSSIGCSVVQEVSISTTGAVLYLQSDTHPHSDAAGGYRWQAWGY